MNNTININNDIININNDIIHINNAKIVYNLFLRKYNLLDKYILTEIINSEPSISYIRDIFDIFDTFTTSNRVDLPHSYYIYYADEKCYESHIKQDVINYAIQFFKVFMYIHENNQYMLDYMKERAIESKEEQFIQLFNEYKK